MKKKIIFGLVSGLLVICGILIAVMFSGKNENITSITVNFNEKHWEKMDLTYAGFENKEAFEKQAEKYIRQILACAGKDESFHEMYGEDGYEILFCITDMASYTDIAEPAIFLNEDLFQHGVAPIAHELTHAILGIHKLDTLSEGIACYMNDKYGTETSMTYGLDPHGLAGMYVDHKDYEPLFAIMGTTETVDASYVEVDIRAPYYQMSDSFVTYLVEKYGMEKFMQLYNDEDAMNAYRDIYGKDVVALQEEWKDFLRGYADIYTEDEVEGLREDLLKRHGYE